MRFFNFIFILLSFSACKAQKPDNPYIDSLQNLYQNRLERYLIKSTENEDFISISEKGITIFASSKDKLNKQAEFELLWEDLDKFQYFLKNFPQKALKLYEVQQISLKTLWDSTQISPKVLQKNATQSLKGFRIALDPGHLAGDTSTAQMEGKIIDMVIDKRRIVFFESELAFLTAKLLEKKLKDLGAEVLISKSSVGQTALEMSYNDWFEDFVNAQIKKDAKKKKKDFDKRIVFSRIFQRQELQARVDKINAFAPDLTLIIHYNVDETNTHWKKTVKDNYAMAFVGGAFNGSELSDKTARFHLLRLLLTADLDNSVVFSEKILKKIKNQMQIPIISKENNQSFLKTKCLFTGIDGVYNRNLTLASRVFGTLCYAEPLYQDNEKEIIRLSEKDFEFDGKKIPSRLEEVADAYLQGILAYLE